MQLMLKLCGFQHWGVALIFGWYAPILLVLCMTGVQCSYHCVWTDWYRKDVHHGGGTGRPPQGYHPTQVTTAAAQHLDSQSSTAQHGVQATHDSMALAVSSNLLC